MIWYVVTDSEENYKRSSAFYNHKFVLEQISGDICLILHYKQVNRDLFEKYNPWVICHSGGSAMYDDYDVLQTKDYCSCISQWEVPQIGFCGGHQIISTQFGSKIGPCANYGRTNLTLISGIVRVNSRNGVFILFT